MKMMMKDLLGIFHLLQKKLCFVCINFMTMLLLLLIWGSLMCAVAHGEIGQLMHIDESISKEVVVDFVLDGDTIEVSDEDGLTDTVRLLGINAPEVGKPDEGTVDKPFAQAAKAFTFQLVNKTVTLYLSQNPEQQRDGFERLLGIIVYQDEVFNTRLLEEGLATRYFIENNDLINYPAWEAKEITARRSNLGLWRNIGSMCVVINEINPNPKGDDKSGEYVELFNRNLTPVDVSRWTFGDRKEAIIPDGTVIPPRGYLILARVSAEEFRKVYPDVPDSVTIIKLKGLILQNSSTPPENLVKYLRDANRAYQDSLTYNLKWDSRGADNTDRSLERVRDSVVNVGDSSVGGEDDKNWDASAVLFGTPGAYNSVHPEFPRWDVNEDGVVDILDIVLVSKHFGEDYRDIPAICSTMLQAVALDAKVELFQNYPNPFNPETWIPYRLSRESNVILEIYATTGQLVRSIEKGYQTAGFYIDKSRAIHWDGCNNNGEKVTGGVYFYTIRAGLFTTTSRRIVLAK